MSLVERAKISLPGTTKLVWLDHMEGKADRYQGNKIWEVRPRLSRDLQIHLKESDIIPSIIEGH